MDPDLLRRTRPLSVALTALLCMWVFGNLYEELVTIAGVLAAPRPGTFPGPLAPGSPVYYYLPWAPVGVILTVVLRVRFRAAVPPRVRRAWSGAIVGLAVAIAAKAVLIAGVNPVLHDPATPAPVVHDHAVLWAVVNGFAVTAVAAALLLVTIVRRPPEDGSGPDSTPPLDGHPRSRATRPSSHTGSADS